MTQKDAGLNITIFFCRRLDNKYDVNRRSIEKDMGLRVKLFPLPCSGRIDPLHLMRALESGADKVYLLACQEGGCRYREGNIRAKKRIAYVQNLIEEVGIERDRVELVNIAAGNSVTIDKLAHEMLAREATVGLSPVRAAEAA